MESRIENAAKIGRIPEDVLLKHEEFSQWDPYFSRGDHDPILQVPPDNTILTFSFTQPKSYVSSMKYASQDTYGFYFDRY